MIERNPLLCHHIEIRHAIAKRDAYGNTTFDTGAGAEVSRHRARVWMTAGREEEGHRDTGHETWFCIVGPDTPISIHDRIAWGNREFDVEAVQPRLGFNRTHHLTIRLTVVEGWDGSSRRAAPSGVHRAGDLG